MIVFTMKNVEKLAKALDIKLKRAVSEMEKGMEDGMWEFEGKFLAEQMTGRPGLNVGTGAGRTSWTVRRSGNVVRMATSAVYMRIHETGGTINMKDKLLTIPACDEARGHFAREFNLKFVQFGRGGLKALVLDKDVQNYERIKQGKRLRDYDARGGKQMDKVMYWLKESVDIPKRLNLVESFNTDGREIIKAAMQKRLFNAIRTN